MSKPAVHRRRLIVTGGVTALGLATALALAAPSAAGAQTQGHQNKVTVIADHLNNPRGLAPAPGGGLYLAEAGRGGKACAGGGEEGTTCAGKTGSFDLVTKHGVKRIVTGLISVSGEGGVAAEGPVSVSRGPDGTFYGLFGLNTHEVPPKGAIPANLRAWLTWAIYVSNCSIPPASGLGPQLCPSGGQASRSLAIRAGRDVPSARAVGAGP